MEMLVTKGFDDEEINGWDYPFKKNGWYKEMLVEKKLAQKIARKPRLIKSDE